MIQHRIEVANVHAHLFKLSLRIEAPSANQRISLPVWIPGSYLVREFARHLSPLQARQGKQDRPISQIDKCTWEIACSGKSALEVSYEVYAFDTSVRAAFLDSRRGFFNGTSVFMRVEGREDEPQAVHITGLPKGWQAYTALPPAPLDGKAKAKTKTHGANGDAQGLRDFVAPDYDALADHPVELGTPWHGEFSCKGVRHEFVVAGAPDDFDGDKLLADTRKVCEAQIAFWHGKRKAPFAHYVFMLNVVEDGYGGLEHRQSTALICSRKDLPRLGRPAPKDGYTTLLGLISHEYFHTWNVKRLKPRAFAPYDYQRENHTRMLWFFEGFTSYYDDQFLLRTQLIDADTYVKLLSKTLNQVMATAGRHQYSLGQASFDAWTRYYRPDENTANATVSYYTKGALVALTLDLQLRQLPAHEGRQPDLDAVMQALWQLGRPIDEGDVAQALAQVAGQPPAALADDEGISLARPAEAWARTLHRWTETCTELPVETLLSSHGVQWLSKEGSLPQQWGVKLQDAAGSPKVQAVVRGGPAEQWGLSVGDELLALDDWRLRKADDLGTWHRPNAAQTLTVCRDQRLLTLRKPGQWTAVDAGRSVVLNLATPAPAATAERRKRWLGS
jgi:predicted metalloprotease with PDZ domain